MPATASFIRRSTLLSTGSPKPRQSKGRCDRYLSIRPLRGIGTGCGTTSSPEPCGADGGKHTSSHGPLGREKPLFGTNPIACALPYQNDPVVIDLSLAKVARGHVLAARNRGGGGRFPNAWHLTPTAHRPPTPNPHLRAQWFRWVMRKVPSSPSWLKHSPPA